MTQTGSMGLIQPRHRRETVAKPKAPKSAPLWVGEAMRGGFAFLSALLTIFIWYAYFVVDHVQWLLAYLQFIGCICWFGLIWIYVANEKRYHAVLAFVLTVTTAATILLGFAIIYRIVGIVEVSTKALSHDAINCLYFSVVTFTTLGYGDFIPPPELRLVAAVEAFAGYLSLALVIAVFAHLWGRIAKSSN